MIYGEVVTLEQMYRLNNLGFEFIIKAGEVTEVVYGSGKTV